MWVNWNANALVPAGITSADLSSAHLAHCVLRGSKLYGLRLESACLDLSDLRDPDVRRAEFGQAPLLQIEVEVRQLCRDGSNLHSRAAEDLPRDLARCGRGRNLH